LPPVRRDLPQDGRLIRANPVGNKIAGTSVVISQTNVVAKLNHLAVVGHLAWRETESSAALDGSALGTIESACVPGEAQYFFANQVVLHSLQPNLDTSLFTKFNIPTCADSTWRDRLSKYKYISRLVTPK
jgi:hypothetical protein